MRTEGGEYRIIQKSLLSLISRASVVSISGEDHGVKSVSKFLWVFQYLGIFVSQHSVFSIFQYLCISLFQYISVSQFKDDYAHFPGEQMDKSCQCCHWAGCKGGRTRTQKAWEFLINISRQHLDVGYMINPDSFYSGLWKRRFTSGLAEVSAPPLLQGYKSSQGEISWDLSNLAIIQLLLYSHKYEVRLTAVHQLHLIFSLDCSDNLRLRMLEDHLKKHSLRLSSHAMCMVCTRILEGQWNT